MALLPHSNWYGSNWYRRPPGMPWEDYQAWQPWLNGPGARWPEYAYDVELLTGNAAPGGTPEALARMWARNTARRIDAVGRAAEGYTIFEARRVAGPSALGQLQIYDELWRLNYPDAPLLGLWLVVETIDDALRAVAARNGVFVWASTDRE